MTILEKAFYEVTSDNQFRCLDGSGIIPFDFVNDDYCDCKDSSDEPGTSACPEGHLYCPNNEYIEKIIPSAWVNDGRCDCCDTSDEYNSTVKCENNCFQLGEHLRLEQQRFREIAEQGSSIRNQYKAEAKQKREQNTQLLEQLKREITDKEQSIKKIEEELNFDFGQDGVFMPLKGKCFSHNDREYTYTFCPFERATQESKAGLQTELGRWGSWTGPQNDLYSRQKYDGGVQCWNGPARSVVVNIACGVQDQLSAVSEPARCEYMYDFQTPAACPDLSPPPSESQQSNTDNQHQQQEAPSHQETQSSQQEDPLGELESDDSLGHEIEDVEHEGHDHGDYVDDHDVPDQEESISSSSLPQNRDEL